ncbi:MAG: arginine--tRNA ligase, partial [Clostridia bacterium]|nr:arginine--tRNA ligase [Clostridia bacterium]
MTDIIQKVNDQIIAVVQKAIGNAIENGRLPGIEVPDINVEKPREKNHGDFSCNTAMMLAKTAKMAPRAIAAAITDNMSLEGSYIEKVEIAGPGFINFFVSDKWLYDTIEMILALGADYGKLNYGNGEKVIVEYVSANPTGPLHMGNARGGALGDLIANVLKKAGFNVTKEFYVNDAGNQIAKLGLS